MIESPTRLKLCPCCGLDLPLDDFYRRIQRGREQLASHCKTCHAAAGVVKRAMNRLLESERVCHICGVTQPIESFATYAGSYGRIFRMYRCDDCREKARVIAHEKVKARKRKARTRKRALRPVVVVQKVQKPPLAVIHSAVRGRGISLSPKATTVPENIPARTRVEAKIAPIVVKEYPKPCMGIQAHKYAIDNTTYLGVCEHCGTTRQYPMPWGSTPGLRDFRIENNAHARNQIAGVGYNDLVSAGSLFGRKSRGGIDD